MYNVVRYRAVSIRDDVHQRLNRLAVERNKSLSDLVGELLDNYENGVRYNDVVEKLGRIETMLRECLSRLSTRGFGA